jgi:enoyl-CoA hydratase
LVGKGLIDSGSVDVDFGDVALYASYTPKDMMFSSRLIDADEALRIGLVDRVVSADSLTDEVNAYAQAVATNSTHSHQVCKSIIETTDGLRIHEGLDFEYTNSPGVCNDMAERLASFQDKAAAKKAKG